MRRTFDELPFDSNRYLICVVVCVAVDNEVKKNLISLFLFCFRISFYFHISVNINFLNFFFSLLTFEICQHETETLAVPCIVSNKHLECMAKLEKQNG